MKIVWYHFEAPVAQQPTMDFPGFYSLIRQMPSFNVFVAGSFVVTTTNLDSVQIQSGSNWEETKAIAEKNGYVISVLEKGPTAKEADS